MIPEREAVVAEAKSWIGTPYHRHAMVKGAGVDCGMLPYAIYRKFDLVPEFNPEFMYDDWFAHTTQEKYLLMVQRYLKRLTAGRTFRDINVPLGSLVLAKVARSKVFNHSGICVGWPMVVHAVEPRVMAVDAVQDPMWATREIEIYDPWMDK